MTETPPRHRLPTLWWWLLGVGIPVTAIFLAVGMSYLLDTGWPLLIFPLGLAIGPGLLAGLGAVSLRLGRILAYAVATIGLLAWVIDYWSEETGDVLLSFLLIPLFFPLVFLLPIGVGIALGIAVGQWRLVGIRVIHPLLVFLAIAIFAWLVPIGGVIRLPSGHSDAAMEANFWQHREQFEQLVQMSNEDAAMTRIAYEFTWPENAVELGFTEVRWNQYRTLFQQTGLSGGLVRRKDGKVIFLFWGFGLVTGGREKGYVYSTQPLHPVVDSLDDIPIPVESLKPIYKKIAENWHLYYQWDD